MAKNRKTMQIGDLTITPEARSRYITLEMGGKKSRIHYKELWGAMFVLGDGKYREAMMPVKKEERMVFSRKLEIAATKDIKAGEKVVIWAEFDVAKSVVAAIAEKNGAKVIEFVDSPEPALYTPPPIDQEKSAVELEH